MAPDQINFSASTKFGKQELVGPAGCAGISFIYFEMGCAVVSAIDRTGDIVLLGKAQPVSGAAPLFLLALMPLLAVLGRSLPEPRGLSPAIPP